MTISSVSPGYTLRARRTTLTLTFACRSNLLRPSAARRLPQDRRPRFETPGLGTEGLPRWQDRRGVHLWAERFGRLLARRSRHPESVRRGRLVPLVSLRPVQLSSRRTLFLTLDLSCSGDLGYLDEEGFLFIADRAKDIVRSFLFPAGYPLLPAEDRAAHDTSRSPADRSLRREHRVCHG